MGAESRHKRDSLSPPFCEIANCDWPYKIQRHRIWPGKEGGKYRLGNVISLCPNHHWASDHGYLSREELFEIVEHRLKKDGIVIERYHPEDTEGSGSLTQAGSSIAPQPDTCERDSPTNASDGTEEGQPSK
jgi:hypothetical protein